MIAHTGRMRNPVALLGLLLIAGCVGPPQPPAPPPRPVAPPSPAPLPPATVADWPDRALTPGQWVYRRDGRGGIAMFGMAGADADLTLRCDRIAGQIFLSRRGTASGSPAITVRTTSMVRGLASQPTGGTPAYMAVALSPQDPLLDAIAYSRGRIAVEQAGTAALILPTWAEITRVIEDCR